MSDWEQRVIEAVGRRTPGRSVDVAAATTLLGETPVVWSAVVVSAAVAGLRTRQWSAVLGPLCVLAGTATARHRLAMVVGRRRPPQGLWRDEWQGPSFPSRHTTLATIGAGLVADTLTTGHRRAARCTAWLVAGAVGASRVVLGVHWPTDVIAGWVFGATALALARRIAR